MRVLLLTVAFALVHTVDSVEQCIKAKACNDRFVANAQRASTDQELYCVAVREKVDCLRNIQKQCTPEQEVWIENDIKTTNEENPKCALVHTNHSVEQCTKAKACNDRFVVNAQRASTDQEVYCVAVIEKVDCLRNIQKQCTPEQEVWIENDITTTNEENPKCALVHTNHSVEQCTKAKACNDRFVVNAQRASTDQEVYCVAVIEKVDCLRNIQKQCTPEQEVWIENDITTTNEENPKCALVHTNHSVEQCTKAKACNDRFVVNAQRASTDQEVYCVAVIEKVDCLRNIQKQCTPEQEVWIENDITTTNEENPKCALVHTNHSVEQCTKAKACNDRFVANAQRASTDQEIYCVAVREKVDCLRNIQKQCTPEQEVRIENDIKTTNEESPKCALVHTNHSVEQCTKAKACNDRFVANAQRASTDQEIYCVAVREKVDCLRNIQKQCTPEQEVRIENDIKTTNEESPKCALVHTNHSVEQCTKAKACNDRFVANAQRASTDQEIYCVAVREKVDCLRNIQKQCTPEQEVRIENDIKTTNEESPKCALVHTNHSVEQCTKAKACNDRFVANAQRASTDQEIYCVAVREKVDCLRNIQKQCTPEQEVWIENDIKTTNEENPKCALVHTNHSVEQCTKAKACNDRFVANAQRASTDQEIYCVAVREKVDCLRNIQKQCTPEQEVWIENDIKTTNEENPKCGKLFSSL